jgi:hypothetical protein
MFQDGGFLRCNGSIKSNMRFTQIILALSLLPSDYEVAL